VPRFVVQAHRATTFHYDLRLEVDGVARSWAVPKGPSTDPSVKRLAVQVADHGLEHLDRDDANTDIWDTGTYESLGGDMAEQLAAGHAKFTLRGDKLRGGWTLQRTDDGAKPQWLLIKRRDG
jgi:DNA ligase D-like protein (predicted 3'-phosphoesterase)